MDNWIKVRCQLRSHPRFLSLANILIFEADEFPGLIRYVCPSAIEEKMAMPPCHESVTELALQRVTVAALRDVALVTLQSVWMSINTFCSVSNDDAICTPMTVDMVDDIAGVEDFGQAMEKVGWLKTSDHNSLVFPNFLEFNEPLCLRPRAMTAAERQRKHRERQKNDGARNGALRRVTTEERRVEERREENKEPPIVPQGGRSDAFDEFWSVVPRKVGKQAAKRAYKKAANVVRREREVGFDEHRFLQERMSDYAKSEVGTSEFCKHPATWLNQGCWDDDDSEWSHRKKSSEIQF